MFARHLPPSAALPVVLALDPAAELACHGEPVTLAAADAGDVDAIVATRWPDALSTLRGRLRPGGRLIIELPATSSDPAEGAAHLAALQDAGFIHCLVEALPDGGWLCRGERAPEVDGSERLRRIADGRPADAAQALVLLICQTPNKPTWRLDPGERRLWEAASVIDPTTGSAALLSFTSLVKAVAFMQPAVLAGFLIGINKTGRFPADAIRAWGLPVLVNPVFEDWRNATAGPRIVVDPASALASDE